MENFKAIILLLAILITGLSAGLFYAWAISVIPGTRRISDGSYLEAMQAINKAILNPGFFIIFFGALILLLIGGYQQYQANMDRSFWFIVGATICYLVGTFGVTTLGNVPMNESLDVIDLNGLNAGKLKSIRESYEGKWNLFHTIRTVFSVLSFISILLAAYFNQTIISKM